MKDVTSTRLSIRLLKSATGKQSMQVEKEGTGKKERERFFLRAFQHAHLEHPELRGILGLLLPANYLAPVLVQCLLLAGANKVHHIVVG